ncbi:MAG: FAD-binding and (Fe-S)-binding domain-containing protein [Acidiferrobacterales bacterium]
MKAIGFGRGAARALPGPYDALCTELQGFIPAARLITDPLRTLAYGTDASFYRLTPKLVVRVESEAEVSRVLHSARRHGTPVTFRGAGTSVSGQAITDSILLVLGSQWKNYEINADASQIRLQPGVIGGHANRYLAPFNRKIGPDPASINIATIGGIAANNASGMCCVLAQNSYNTLVSARTVLADGTVLDTGDKASRQAFAETHKHLLADIDALARRTRANTKLANRIREKFKIRNTTGYSINALLDFQDPIDILQHLMIGSEGTLGFISEITYRTVPDPPHKASALILFPDVKTACEAAVIAKAQPVAAVELMDRASLRSVEDKPGMPDYLKQLPDEAASLLLETRAADSTSLKQQVHDIERTIGGVETLLPIRFTDRAEEYTRLWNVRKGLYPSVGAMRDTGTSVITEDVVFRLPELATATVDLQQLLRKYSYHEAIILGHALEGNLHLIFTEDFGRAEAIDRYSRFMEDYTRLVVDKYQGSLKGEHGTGRNIAPYVELEWGQEAYQLMRAIKSILDSDNILNPGVILNNDPQVHLKNLKPLFPVDPIVDKCIECGFCELTCPSNTLTLTPRQRIVGLRELARLEASGEDPKRLRTLRALYRYQGIDTCAADGLCLLACPVDIDTGQMIKSLRARRVGKGGSKAASLLAENFSLVSKVTRGALRAANLAHTVLGTSLMESFTSGVHKLSAGYVPLWNPYVPTAAKMPTPRNDTTTDRPRVVYFPSCTSRTMGPAKGDPERESLPVKTEALLRKAGYEVVYPDSCDQLCCGMPFESKGLVAQANAKASETVQSLLYASHDGQDPTVSDTSPCTLYLKQKLENGAKVFDITEFIHDFVMGRLTFRTQSETVALYPTCSLRKMGLENKLKKIAEACVEKVVVPENVACCGWAGDKGFTHPELNASALRALRPSLPADCLSGYSTSRTCEIGLSYHSGRYYRSIVYLVDRCTQPKTQ